MGDLVWDTVIGFRDMKNDKIIFRSISFELYNERNREHNLPKEHIVKIVIDSLRALKQDKGDRILLFIDSCFALFRAHFNLKKKIPLGDLCCEVEIILKNPV